MKNVFCTLFDIGYASKGLALWKSMQKCMSEFELYIFAGDDKTYELFNKMCLNSVKIVRLDECFDDETRNALEGRQGAELYWSCTSSIIKYVLKFFGEEWCTYVDADCIFYKDPTFTFDIMEKQNFSVGVVEHNFRQDKDYDSLVKKNGRFCVEFNTFRNCKDALEILDEWHAQCLKPCSTKAGGETFGDQLYLNEWPEKYNCVYINENKGIGVAPWNVTNFENLNGIIMYHFHALHFIGRHIASMNLWNMKSRKEIIEIRKLYKSYINELKIAQDTIEKIALDNVIDEQTKADDISNLKKENIYSYFRRIVEKLNGRKEKNIIQLFDNIIWVK